MDRRALYIQLKERIEPKDLGSIDEQILFEAFGDLDKVLDFGSMSESDLSECLNCLAGIRILIPLPSKTERDSFFQAAEQILKGLTKWNSSPLRQSFVNNDLHLGAIDFEEKLKELVTSQGDWGKGRPPALNQWQSVGIRKVCEFLRSSQQDPRTAERWKGFEIEAKGRFDDRKITVPNPKYLATPARLISNFAKGLGLDIPQLSVEYALKKERTETGSSGLASDEP